MVHRNTKLLHTRRGKSNSAKPSEQKLQVPPSQEHETSSVSRISTTLRRSYYQALNPSPVPARPQYQYLQIQRVWKKRSQIQIQKHRNDDGRQSNNFGEGAGIFYLEYTEHLDHSDGYSSIPEESDHEFLKTDSGGYDEDVHEDIDKDTDEDTGEDTDEDTDEDIDDDEDENKDKYSHGTIRQMCICTYTNYIYRDMTGLDSYTQRYDSTETTRDCNIYAATFPNGQIPIN